MGFDLYGKNASTKEGEYFRSSVWSWRPLASYVCGQAPDITSKCEAWQTNDGKGLNMADSIKLADMLQAEIDAGRTKQYEMIYRSEMERMPDVDCELCEGTGTRKAIPERGAGDPKNGGIPCNGCKATGHRRPVDTMYPFDAEHVQEFVTFLRGCGGFQIW